MLGKHSKAWNLLKEDEKVALSLKYAHEKSTWQAGEIMDRAHYKYMEICQRAERYIKLYQEHLLIHDELIPDYLNISDFFRFYLESTIVQRLTVKETLDKIDIKSKLRDRPHREALIIKEINKLRKSAELYERTFVLFILEFDRWNNFRILPKEIQEPSAFKRRNKNNDKKNIKNIKTLNPFCVLKLKEKYSYHHNHPDTKFSYVPIFNDPEVQPFIKIKKTDKIIREISRIGFYIFHKEELALEFYDLLMGYDLDTNKHCKEGQKFWPKYRILITKSLNYNMIQKIMPSRKFFEATLKDLDLNLINSKKKLKNPNK